VQFYSLIPGLSANRKLRPEKQPRGIGNDRSGFRLLVWRAIFGRVAEGYGVFQAESSRCTNQSDW